MDKVLFSLVISATALAVTASASYQDSLDIDRYHEKLKDDISDLEQKAIYLSKKECVAGEEVFEICSTDLNIIDFLLCLLTPYVTYDYDPLRRTVYFPDGTFKQTPAVLVGIKGVGSLMFGDVKVSGEEVTYKGFDIVVSGGYPAFPYSVTVQWIACPRKDPLSPSVEDFQPTYREPEPYVNPREAVDSYPFVPVYSQKPSTTYPTADFPVTTAAPDTIYEVPDTNRHPPPYDPYVPRNFRTGHFNRI